MGNVHAKEKPSAGQRSGNFPPEEETHSRTFSGNIKVKVERINIDGLGRTKDDIVVEQIRDVFGASSFKELIEKTGNAKLKLERLGIFNGVGVFIDTSKGETDHPDGLDVTFNVKELRRVAGSAHTSIGNNEGNVVLGVRIPNMFGRVETLRAEYTHGTKHSTGYNVTFTKPFSKKLDKRFVVSGFKSSAEYLPSSYRETDRGIITDATFAGILGKHSLRWEGVWREISCMTRTASFDIREQSGHSLKSSLKLATIEVSFIRMAKPANIPLFPYLYSRVKGQSSKHIFSRDTRNESVFPVKGYLVKTTQEVAGFTGGNVNFMKSEAEVQVNKTIFWDWVLSLCLQGGVMKSLSDSPTLVQDRYFLGGPTSVRGFNNRGLGPHSQGDSLGGEAYCALGLHLYTPLPFQPGRGRLGELFRTHFFINAGNMCNLQLDENTWQEHIAQVRDTLRWSYGAGLVLRLGTIARFELNYCIPQTALVTDNINSGLQFGVGVSFL